MNGDLALDGYPASVMLLSFWPNTCNQGKVTSPNTLKGIWDIQSKEKLIPSYLEKFNLAALPDKMSVNNYLIFTQSSRFIKG